VNEATSLVLLQYVFRRKHMQAAETNVLSMPMLVAVSDQSTQVFYVNVVMLLRVALVVQD